MKLILYIVGDDTFRVGGIVGERHLHLSNHGGLHFVGMTLCLGVFDILFGIAKKAECGEV